MSMSEAAKKRIGDATRARHAAKKAAELAAALPGQLTLDKAIENVSDEPKIEQPEPQPETIETEPDVNELIRQINELKDMQLKLMAQNLSLGRNGAQVGVQGLVGTVDRYPVEAELYPDYTDRLSKEPKLQRFAFPINYELKFEVSETSYTTIDNVRMREPKFSLELIRVMLDEETGEDTGSRYLIARLTMHEDPDTAITLAKQLGVDIESMSERVFLNEMRYLRMQSWLLNCFYPPAVETKTNRRQMVIEGRLVDYWEKNTEDRTGITKEQWDKTPRIKF